MLLLLKSMKTRDFMNNFPTPLRISLSTEICTSKVSDMDSQILHDLCLPLYLLAYLPAANQFKRSYSCNDIP